MLSAAIPVPVSVAVTSAPFVLTVIVADRDPTPPGVKTTSKVMLFGASTDLPFGSVAAVTEKSLGFDPVNVTP